MENNDKFKWSGRVNSLRLSSLPTIMPNNKLHMTLLQITHIVLFRLDVGSTCDFEDKAKFAKWGYIGIDLIINIFVTIRLIQILTKGIRNSKDLNQMTERSPNMNNLFKAANYWGYLQLGSTLIFNSLAIVEIIPSLKFGSILTIRIFQTLNNILFSLLITNDKKIVKIIARIEDNDNDNNIDNIEISV
ncbi:unnamed protein product [Rhizophagus irregularis]|nr:unnamed protein product [Rhizophagus irregularis]